MDQSSRNRLTSRHQELFAGSSLFDKIARAVCRAETLPRKELYEAWEMAKRVRRNYRGGRVLDLACGHGLLAHIMLILDDSSDLAIAVDRHIPQNASRLSASLTETWPRLSKRILFQQMDIHNVQVHSGDIIVSAHACGTLTDMVIEKAVSAKARLAVLPCCHNLKQSTAVNFEQWMDGSLAMDVLRAAQLQLKGYKIIAQKIPDTITPKNRLLMGEYIRREE